jgi:hypothetical protein
MYFVFSNRSNLQLRILLRCGLAHTSVCGRSAHAPHPCPVARHHLARVSSMDSIRIPSLTLVVPDHRGEIEPDDDVLRTMLLGFGFVGKCFERERGYRQRQADNQAGKQSRENSWLFHTHSPCVPKLLHRIRWQETRQDSRRSHTIFYALARGAVNYAAKSADRAVLGSALRLQSAQITIFVPQSF